MHLQPISTAPLCIGTTELEFRKTGFFVLNFGDEKFFCHGTIVICEKYNTSSDAKLQYQTL